LHLVSLTGMGGRAATALRQARLLSGRGHRVLMGCLAGSAVEVRAREMGLQVFSDFKFCRGFRPLTFWRDCRRVAAICRTQQVDVLHAHLSQESWVGCLGARLAWPRPSVVRSRGVVVPVRPHIFNRLLHNRLTDHIIAPSKVIYDHLVALPGFDCGKVSLIPDGVDLARFSPQVDSSAVREEFHLSPTTPLIVMVARLERVKGHAIFFQALAELARRSQAPEWQALCACDERTPGVYEATVRCARELGLSEQRLRFTGFRSDVEKIIAAATVVVLPSLGSEGSSRVALEAGAAAVPVVASAVGCLPEVIENGVTGLIVPPSDPHALAEAILSIIQNPEKARDLGRAARKRVENLYDERNMVERLEEVYLKGILDCGF
ncbi:MAG: glycosyltransferase family 4 protein, partial [Planctomycetota bacterium]